ncbi:MAG: acyl-CoA dehydrogenase family protein [Parvularculales bacterium]
MNFDFSDDQKLLKDQARKFLTDNCPLTEVRDVLENDKPHAEKIWKGIAEMGFCGAAIPEQYGGLGLGALELCVVAEELGRALAPIPFSSSIYLFAESLKLAGSESQNQMWLPKIASGESIGTLAMAEGVNTPGPNTIRAEFSGGTLSGIKLPVPDAEASDVAVVLCRTGGQGERALSLVLVDLSSKGITRRSVKTLDASRSYGEINFDKVPAELLGVEGEGWSHVQRVLDGAAVLFAFEQVGGAEAALEMAKSYALERYAFGRLIGSYQAIKHKLADMYVRNELARSNAYYGAMMLNTDGAELPIAAAAARVAASEAFCYAAQENVQTHGGIGFTWEGDCQFFYRRSRLLALALGSETQWKEKLVRHLEAKNAA